MNDENQTKKTMSQLETLNWLAANNMSIESLMPTKIIKSIELANKRVEERSEKKRKCLER